MGWNAKEKNNRFSNPNIEFVGHHSGLGQLCYMHVWKARQSVSNKSILNNIYWPHPYNIWPLNELSNFTRIFSLFSFHFSVRINRSAAIAIKFDRNRFLYPYSWSYSCLSKWVSVPVVWHTHWYYTRYLIHGFAIK